MQQHSHRWNTLNEPFVNSGNSDGSRVAFNLTDDYLDPGKGLRLDIA